MKKNISELSLFRLIKSLTGNEKGYFKKYMSQYSRKGNSIYMSMFEILDSQEEYDIDELCNELKTTRKTIGPKKHYLYERILDALAAYNAANNDKLRLAQYFKHIDILIERGYYDDAYVIIQKAKVICLRSHDIFSNFRLLFTEMQIVSVVFKNLNERNEISKKILADIKKNQEDINHSHQIKTLGNGTISGAEKMYQSQSKEELFNWFENRINELDNVKLNYSNKAEFEFIKGSYYKNYPNDYSKSLEAYRTSLSLLEAEKFHLKDHTSALNYSATLGEIANISARLGKKIDFDSVLKKIISFPTNHKRILNSYSSWFVYHHQIQAITEWSMYSGDFKYFNQLDADKLKQYSSEDNPLNLALIQIEFTKIGICYFIQGHTKRARFFYQKGIDTYYKKQIPDTYLVTLILLFLLNLHEGDFDLYSHITNTKNWLKKSNRQYAINFMFFLDKIKEIDKSPKKERARIYSEILAYFEGIYFMRSNEIKAWVNTQNSPISLIDAYQKYAKAQVKDSHKLFLKK